MKMSMGLSILLLGSLSVTAKQTIYKDWVINTDSEQYYYAATINNGGHVFGKYCYFENSQCIYLVSVDTTCVSGNQYPGLINSVSGSMYINLICGKKTGDQYTLIFDGFDDIELMIKSNGQLGVVIPVENGNFQVLRFSLSGATYSIDAMTKAAEKHVTLSQNLIDSEFI
jgi:hypothetical protein